MDESIYTGQEAHDIVIDILASQEGCQYPAHQGARGYYKNELSTWSAFDNTTMDCWREDFSSEEEARAWCLGGE